MIQLVIFDMAGTVFDEKNRVYKTIHEICVEQDMDISLEQVLESAGGKEKKAAFRDLLATYSEVDSIEESVQIMYEAFLARLKQNYREEEVALFPPVRPCIQWLRQKGVSIALSTGYVRSIAQLLVRQAGLKPAEDFDLLVTADDLENGRPHPDMIYLICDRMGIAPLRTVKIGDTQIDVLEGKNAGVGLSVAVTTGAQRRSYLKQVQPDAILNSLAELPTLINNLEAEEE